MKKMALLLVFVMTSFLLYAQVPGGIIDNKTIEKEKKKERINKNVNNGSEYIGDIMVETIGQFSTTPYFTTLELYVKVIQGQKFFQIIDESGIIYSVTKNPDYNGAQWYEKTKWYHKYTHMAGKTDNKYYFNLDN